MCKKQTKEKNERQQRRFLIKNIKNISSKINFVNKATAGKNYYGNKCIVVWDNFIIEASPARHNTFINVVRRK